MWFKKKPVWIEAFKWTGSTDCFEPWASDALDRGIIMIDSVGSMQINTLEGCMNVSVGDYVIKGVRGELYACDEDIFNQTYESDSYTTLV